MTIENYEDPDVAAQQYESNLRRVLNDRPIDMVLLGLGPDGHTASLFPNHELLQYSGDRMVMPIFDSPKPPSRRITLTLETLSNSTEVMFIATGEGKAQRLKDILFPPEDNEVSTGAVVYPPSLIRPGRLLWVIDQPAAHLITDHENIDIIEANSEL